MPITCSVCITENNDNTISCIACGSPLSTMQSVTYHLPPNAILKHGKYQIEQVLGEGGFAITYRGIDLVNGRKVAIKENLPEKAIRQRTTIIWPSTVTPQQRQWQLSKCATEAEYVAKCVHPNIVKVYDWFEENNTAYIVMDFLAGQPLSKIISTQKRLPKEQVKRYFIQLAEALRVIHSANLLHRDIKPDNIIIDQSDRPILIDFGATKEFIAGQTRQMSVTLTHGYAPLEQYSYKSKRWPATDIYALCATMYELLTGELPPEATDRIQTETLTPPSLLVPGIDPLLEQVILTGMKMRVEERFQTADELLKVLTGGSQTAKLIATQPNISIKEFFLDKSKLIVGRRDEATEIIDIDLDSFPGSHTVSRRHAEISRVSGQWQIQDNGSLNGTFIKRQGNTRFNAKITGIEILNTGDEISFGKVRFRFQTI